MRRSIMLVAVSLLALTLAACTDDNSPTGPVPSASSKNLTGLGGIIIERPPTRPGPNDFVDITAGDNHTCARKINNKVYCWGLDNLNQTGYSTTRTCYYGSPCTDRPTLLMKAAGGWDTLRASKLDAGSNHTCIIDTLNDAWCWGDGNWGQLGFAVGSYSTSNEPLPVVGGLKFTSIGAGSGSTCGTSGGLMYCWGKLMNRAAVPTLVSTYNGGYNNVTVGDLHACTTENPGYPVRPVCWGNNTYGQLGIDMSMIQNAPFAVGTFFGNSVVRATTQQNFTCVEQTNGTVQCAGSNSNSQLGLPTSTWATGTPQTIVAPVLHGVSTGTAHACGLDASGNAWCWGNGYWGQVGNGDASANPTALAVTGGHTYRAIAAGANHTCAIGTDNHIYCWGTNHEGQLGTMYPGGWVSTPVQALDPIL